MGWWVYSKSFFCDRADKASCRRFGEPVYNDCMATLTIEVPDDVKTLAEARAAEAGCSDVGEYVAELIRGEAVAAPDGLTVSSDEQLEALLLRRLDGPSVEMDAADFARIRDRLRGQIEPGSGRTP